MDIIAYMMLCFQYVNEAWTEKKYLAPVTQDDKHDTRSSTKLVYGRKYRT